MRPPGWPTDNRPALPPGPYFTGAAGGLARQEYQHVSDPPSDRFHLRPPLWAVLDPETVETDPRSGAVAVKHPVKAAARVIDGTTAALLFTAERLADQYIRGKGLGGVALPLQSRVHVVDFLERQIPGGLTHVAFDLEPDGGTCRWKVSIEDVLREAGARSQPGRSRHAPPRPR